MKKNIHLSTDSEIILYNEKRKIEKEQDLKWINKREIAIRQQKEKLKKYLEENGKE